MRHTVLLLPLLLANCRGGETLKPCMEGDPVCAPIEEECSPARASQIFARSIAPLVGQQRASSCSGCHMTGGLELSDFIRNTPCRSMACLLDRELVDFEQPAKSHILGLIARGFDKDDENVRAAAEREHAAFEAWIAFGARCHDKVCGEIDDPCALPVEPDAQVDAARDARIVDAARPPPDAGLDARAPDAGLDAARDALRDAVVDQAVDLPIDASREPCTDPWLQDLFFAKVWPWHNRCYHCHAGDGVEPGISDAPTWMQRGHERDSSDATLARLLEWGHIDASDPEHSLVLLKPLAERHGGVEHRGGAKFRTLEDPAYRDLLYFTVAYGLCQNPELDTSLPDATFDFGTDASDGGRDGGDGAADAGAEAGRGGAG